MPGLSTTDRMKIINDCFSAMCKKVGYQFHIKVDPKSDGHKFHIRISFGDETIFESRKIRTHPKYEPQMGAKMQNSKSPDLDNLLKTINEKLALGGREPLQIPDESDDGFTAWLLFASSL